MSAASCSMSYLAGRRGCHLLIRPLRNPSVAWRREHQPIDKIVPPVRMIVTRSLAPPPSLAARSTVNLVVACSLSHLFLACTQQSGVGCSRNAIALMAVRALPALRNVGIG